jgi:hypothetical protein
MVSRGSEKVDKKNKKKKSKIIKYLYFTKYNKKTRIKIGNIFFKFIFNLSIFYFHL